MSECLDLSGKSHPLGRDGLLRRLHGNAEGLKECRRIILNHHLPAQKAKDDVTFAEFSRAQRRELVLIGLIERDLELCDRYGITKPLSVASLIVDTTYFDNGVDNKGEV
jgi:hypothetical protein